SSVALVHSVAPVQFLHAPAPAPLHPLSLHDALPICRSSQGAGACGAHPAYGICGGTAAGGPRRPWPLRTPDAASGCASGGLTARSEEHTSELQSRENLVCRLLPEKNKRRPATATPGS